MSGDFSPAISVSQAKLNRRIGFDSFLLAKTLKAGEHAKYSFDPAAILSAKARVVGYKSKANSYRLRALIHDDKGPLRQSFQTPSDSFVLKRLRASWRNIAISLIGAGAGLQLCFPAPLSLLKCRHLGRLTKDGTAKGVRSSQVL